MLLGTVENRLDPDYFRWAGVARVMSRSITLGLLGFFSSTPHSRPRQPEKRRSPISGFPSKSSADGRSGPLPALLAHGKGPDHQPIPVEPKICHVPEPTSRSI
jgi:hypothetical protein